MFKYNERFEELKKWAMSEKFSMEYVTLTCSREYCAVMFTVSNHAGKREVGFGEAADRKCSQPLHEAVQEATILGLEAFFNCIQQEQQRAACAAVDVEKPMKEYNGNTVSTGVGKSDDKKKEVAACSRALQQGADKNGQVSKAAGVKPAKSEPVFDMETSPFGGSKHLQTGIAALAEEKKGLDEPISKGKLPEAAKEVKSGGAVKENSAPIALAIDSKLSFTESDKEDFRLELGKYQQRDDNWISQILQSNPAFINDILSIKNPTLKYKQMISRTKMYIVANDIKLEEAINRFNEQRKYA